MDVVIALGVILIVLVAIPFIVEAVLRPYPQKRPEGERGEESLWIILSSNSTLIRGGNGSSGSAGSGLGGGPCGTGGC